METKNDSSNPSPVSATSSKREVTMYNDHDSSNPSPVHCTSYDLIAIPSAGQHVPTAAGTSVFETEVKLSDLQFDAKLQMRAKPHDGQYIMHVVGVIQPGTLTEPIVVFRDPNDGSLRVELLQQILSDNRQYFMALPNPGVPQHLVSEVREEAASSSQHECLRDHGRPTDAQRSVPATPNERFREMMGYNPSPRRALDQATLGVLAEELDQERLTA